MKVRTGWVHRAAVLLLLVSAACGGGGGGGGGGGTPPPPTVNEGFTLTPSSAGAPAVVLAEGSGTTTSVLDLEIQAQGMTDLYGVAFDLTYPQNLMDFEAFSEGDFLSSGGLDTVLRVFESEPGRIVVGVTRLGAQPGQAGSGELLTLRFRATTPGSGSFRFENAEAFRSGGNALGANFADATVQVRL
jgi:hypothetical protein